MVIEVVLAAKAVPMIGGVGLLKLLTLTLRELSSLRDVVLTAMALSYLRSKCSKTHVAIAGIYSNHVSSC